MSGDGRPSGPGCTKCGHLACVCEILADHKEGCAFRRSATCAIPIECDHGYDVCPECDPCTCKKERSTMATVAKCKKGKPCKGLRDHYLNDEANVHQKGLTLMVTTNLKTRKRTVAGVAYRKKGNDRPLFINFCPSCGESLESWREDVIAKKEAVPA